MKKRNLPVLLDRRLAATIALSLCCFLLLALGALAQPAPQGGATPQRAGRPGPALPQPLDDETGFKSIFDGKTLSGWDCDPRLWRVEDGIIIGETTPENAVKQNTFLIWRGGRPADFELKLEYRLASGNSGVQYRSVELPGVQWGMKGYQADMDAQERYTGQIYEERGRGFLALRGQSTYIGEGKRPGIVGSLGENEALKGLIKSKDWNSMHIIARGNLLVQIVNGHVMSMVIDDDVPNRQLNGLIGIQLHTGPPMKVEARNIRVKLY